MGARCRAHRSACSEARICMVRGAVLSHGLGSLLMPQVRFEIMIGS
jgi:hypothetical protein